MKGASTFLMGVLLIVVGVFAYYNFSQQKTIDLLNHEILEQARLRHELILKKQVLEHQVEILTNDTVN